MKIYRFPSNTLTEYWILKLITRSLSFTETILKSNSLRKFSRMTWEETRKGKRKKKKSVKSHYIIFFRSKIKCSKIIKSPMRIGILSIRICLQSLMSLIARLQILKPKATIRKDFWCFGHLKTLLFRKKYLQASFLSLHVSSVSKIPTSLHVDHKMEQFQFMTSEKRAILRSPKTGNLWISIQMQFGTFNGFQKARAEREKHWFRSAQMAESQNGQWKKALNATISCS